MKGRYYCLISGLLCIALIYPSYVDCGVWAALLCLLGASVSGYLFFKKGEK